MWKGFFGEQLWPVVPNVCFVKSRSGEWWCACARQRCAVRRLTSPQSISRPNLHPRKARRSLVLAKDNRGLPRLYGVTKGLRHEKIRPKYFQTVYSDGMRRLIIRALLSNSMIQMVGSALGFCRQCILCTCLIFMYSKEAKLEVYSTILVVLINSCVLANFFRLISIEFASFINLIILFPGFCYSEHQMSNLYILQYTKYLSVRLISFWRDA